MTNIEKARKWLKDNALNFLQPRDVSLAALLDETNVKEIAAWLHGLEVRLYEEIQRTGDSQLLARRGVYEGIAAEIVGGNWRKRSARSPDHRVPFLGQRQAAVDEGQRPVGMVCSRYGCTRVGDLATEMGCMCREHSSPLLFPIQRPYELRYIADAVPEFVPWEFMRPHDNQARTNHGGQSLSRLSNRGGLSIKEVICVIDRRDYREVEPLSRAECARRLKEALDAWRDMQHE